MEQRPAPEVTIRDPARPERAADVLVVGHQPPASRRTRMTAAGAVLVLLAGVAAAATVRDARHEEAQEEEQRTSAVELRLRSGEASGSGSYDRQTDTATLELLLPVHNHGSDPVTVLSGGIGGYGLTRPVELPAGARGLLPLNQTVDCSAVEAIPRQDGTVELSVRAAAGVPPRRLELVVLIPFPDEQARRVCGSVPRDRP